MLRLPLAVWAYKGEYLVQRVRLANHNYESNRIEFLWAIRLTKKTKERGKRRKSEKGACQFCSANPFRLLLLVAVCFCKHSLWPLSSRALFPTLSVFAKRTGFIPHRCFCFVRSNSQWFRNRKRPHNKESNRKTHKMLSMRCEDFLLLAVHSKMHVLNASNYVMTLTPFLMTINHINTHMHFDWQYTKIFGFAEERKQFCAYNAILERMRTRGEMCVWQAPIVKQWDKCIMWMFKPGQRMEYTICVWHKRNDDKS